jgi:hypothetical protein
MTARPRSEKAIEAAIDVMGDCARGTALVVLAMALAKDAQRTIGKEKAAELAYMVADQLASDLKA